MTGDIYFIVAHRNKQKIKRQKQKKKYIYLMFVIYWTVGLGLYIDKSSHCNEMHDKIVGDFKLDFYWII